MYIKILISLFLLTFLSFKIDWSKLAGALAEIGGLFWGLALFALVVQITLLAARWFFFVNLDRRRIDFATSWRITMASLIANLLFITSLGGFVVKIAMTTQWGFPLLKSVCAGIADRIMTLFAVALLALVMLPLTVQHFSPEHLQGLFWLYALGVIGLTGFVLFARKLAWGKIIFYNRKTALAAHYIRALLTRHSTLANIVAVSLVAQMFYFGSVLCLIHAMDLSLSFHDVMAVLPFVTLVASLPIGFGGWGVREGAFIYGFGLIGVPLEAAFLLSVQIGFLTMLSTIIVGIPALVSGDIGFIFERVQNSRYKRVLSRG